MKRRDEKGKFSLENCENSLMQGEAESQEVPLGAERLCLDCVWSLHTGSGESSVHPLIPLRARTARSQHEVYSNLSQGFVGKVIFFHTPEYL